MTKIKHIVAAVDTAMSKQLNLLQARDAAHKSRGDANAFIHADELEAELAAFLDTELEDFVKTLDQ